MEEEKINPVENNENTEANENKAEVPLETTEEKEIVAEAIAEPAEEREPEAEVTIETAEVPETEAEVAEEQPKEKKAKPARKRNVKAESTQKESVPTPDITFEKLDADLSEDEDEDAHAVEESYDHLTREQLVEMLEATVKEDDVNLIKNKVAKIKVCFWKISKDEQQKHFDKYISEGGKKEEYAAPEDKLEEKYNAAFNIYKEKRNKFLEGQEKQKQDNLKSKLQILEELKVLINSEETLKKTYDDFKVLQDKWASLGQVPRLEVNTLWQNYHYLVDKFFDKVKINKELKDLDLKKNVEKQLSLCEKAEELMLEPSILKSFKQLQKYHDEWKEIGPIYGEKKEELWERFRSATDRINQRRREYYDNLHDEQEKNLLAKAALCEKAEQLNNVICNTPNEWKDVSDQFYELQQIWKTIGYAPKKDNNEIWERFRVAVNSFHTNKDEFFNKTKEEQVNNYNLKINICVQAEAIQDNQDWKKTTNELIHFQNEWKNIGPVPAKYSLKIWKRFRAACDHFFESKSKYFSNIEKSQDDNLNLKLELIKKVEEYQILEDNNENLNNLKEFQKEWMNIGHVPMDKKDKIYNDFKAAINRNFEKLKTTPSDKIDLRYKSKFESITDSPNADWAINKEMTFLNTKLSGLKNDIKLWENNIGFLAHSKNADILKEEFQKKIDSAKEQLASLQEKLSYLNSTKRNLKSKN